MTLPRRDAFHHTYAEYFRWDDEKRYELIGGIAYVKEPPAPTRFHQELVGELYYQVKVALEAQRWRTYVAPFDVRLPKAGEADDLVDTVVQPDVLIVRDLSKLDGRGMRGAPDWIAEVLSPTTSRHDQFVKIPVYERVGVLEVWLIHPIERTLTVYRLENGRYGRPIILELKGRATIGALPGVSVDWDRILPMLE
jgi:Uma2 family endonuclease